MINWFLLIYTPSPIHNSFSPFQSLVLCGTQTCFFLGLQHKKTNYHVTSENPREKRKEEEVTSSLNTNNLPHTF